MLTLTEAWHAIGAQRAHVVPGLRDRRAQLGLPVGATHPRGRPRCRCPRGSSTSAAPARAVLEGPPESARIGPPIARTQLASCARKLGSAAASSARRGAGVRCLGTGRALEPGTRYLWRRRALVTAEMAE